MGAAVDADQWRRFFVPGSPMTKGHKSVGRAGQVYETGGQHLKDWMATVATYAMANRKGLRIASLCGVQLDFYITGRDKDLDTLERAVWDSLVAGGLLADDKFIVESSARKFQVPQDRAGCQVYIYRIDAEPS